MYRDYLTNMLNRINAINNAINNVSAITSLKTEFNSYISNERLRFAKLPLEEKKIIGPQLAALKKEIESAFELCNNKFRKVKLNFDPSLPVYVSRGIPHPVSVTINRIKEILVNWGFSYGESPEIESTNRCFDLLNIAETHPCRDEFQSFILSENKVLRPHTSPFQTYVLNKPGKYFTIGKTYRRDHLDKTHSPMFHQLEVISTINGNLMDLQKFIENFLLAFFGTNIRFRLRPSYFPFTEPSFEGDVWFNDSWMEIFGCGIINPNVFKLCNYKPLVGYAIGFGVERLAMQKYEIVDLRDLYSENIEPLQFVSNF